MALVPTVTTVYKDNWNSVISFNRDTQVAFQKIGSILLGPESVPTFAGSTLTGPLDMNDQPITNTGYIDFDLTPVAAVAEGRMIWNADDGTLNLGMPGGDVNLQVGQEEIQRVRNDEASTITNGSVVYISGSTGDRANVKLANANSYTTSYVLGVATEDIATNQTGYITTAGLVRDINTAGLSYGVPLWLGTTSGTFTQTMPDAPNMAVFIGYVVRAHATEGIITVRPTVIPRLSMLSDVYGTHDTTGQFPVWDQTNGYFTLTHNISEFQPVDTELSAIAALTPTDSNIIVGDGSTWVAESGATARTSLGLGTTDRPTFDGLVAVRSVTSGALFGCDLGIIADTSGGDMTSNYGQRVYCQATGANNITSFLRANSSYAYHSGTGTIASLGCLQSQVAVLSTGVVTDVRNVEISNPNMGSSTGTIGTNTGLYIGSQSHARVTTAYGIRQVGSTDINNFVGKSKFGTAGTPAENVHASDTVRADIAFNLNGTDGVTQASSAGKVCDVTALAGGIATAQTQITYATDGTYNFDATAGKVSSITIVNGRITAITTA